MADLFQIGLSGVYSSQANLATTSNNIANVNTEGYSRQSVDVKAAEPGKYGSYFIGNGAMVANVERAYDQFAFSENLMNSSQLGYAQQAHQHTGQLDALLSNEGTSAAKPVLAMFDRVNDMADNPNALETREVFLGQANSMVAQYHLLYEGLQSQYADINTDISSSAANVTTLGDDIAALNSRITALQASGKGEANDLLDKRDQAITALSQYVDVSVVGNDNDMVNVYIGSGQPLVMGDESRTMVAVKGSPDPSRTELALQVNGSRAALDGSSLGGSIAGLFDARNNDVEDAMNQLGHNVIGLTHAINEQQAQGMTLTGEVGDYIFNDVNDTQSMQNRVLAHNDDLGSAQLSVRVDDLSALSADEFKLVVDAYTPAVAGTVDNPAVPESITFSATNLSNGETQTLHIPDMAVSQRIDIENAGLSVAVDQINDQDPLQVGKAFTLRPTRMAAQAVSVSETQPEKIAAAATPIQVSAGTENAQDANIRINAIGASSDPLYMSEDNPLHIQVTDVDNDSGVITYNVVDNTGLVVTLPDDSANHYQPAVVAGDPLQGLTLTPDAWSSKVSLNIGGVEIEMDAGALQVDDTFTLAFNETGVGDNSNMLAIADLQNQKLMKGGNSTTSDVYSQLISELGSKSANADVSLKTMEILQSQSFERIQKVSGVNMDEEAANLLQYQQYYSASARVISIADEIFDTILNIG